ncbi:UDP-glucose dehydrogenase family protein [Cohnella suwonensis]|uniref:UDP-glucose 6-dehydrogenase n=1 Tax=Cohnella suwonensis TaxID=696072 RepID=A0ABW0M5G6_9BACL
MRIAVVGTGYVGLVTGVCLSEIGHEVICIDIDEAKIEKLNNGFSPIYEPGLEQLLNDNIAEGRLSFTTDFEQGFQYAQAIYIAVGTPQRDDGSANLDHVETVARSIANHIREYVVVVTKSTVPVGTNHRIKQIIEENMVEKVPFNMVSNPEFLREGTAVHDTFHGDRIVIGADSDSAAEFVKEINKPFGIAVFCTDIQSAEMIKYASNAFLATKISFINEISNLCEKLDANVEDVSHGMGMDQRIGRQFLQAGIGYGGSCFPKDTKALIQIAGNVEHEFDLLKSVVRVNNKQQKLLVKKAKDRFGSLEGKTITILGLAFKPNTDDMRESASIVICDQLIRSGAIVKAYDPIAIEKARSILNPEVVFAASIEVAVTHADCMFILTEWSQFKQMDLTAIRTMMKEAIIFDGRNIFSLELMKEKGFEYHSVGRASLYPIPVAN